MTAQQPNPVDLDRPALLALLEASRIVNERSDLTGMLEHVTRAAAKVMRARAASLLTLDPRRNELVFQTACGPAREKLRGARMPADRGIAGQAVRTGRAVRVDDVRTNRNFFDEIDLQTDTHTSGLLAAPLIHHGETLGVVEVLNPFDRPHFADDDLKLLQVFANLAATAMQNARTLDQCHRENQARRTAHRTARLVGESDVARDVVALCQRVAEANTTVLIVGETGTGKEIAARYIHQQSGRADRPFVAVNCAAVTETLIESELFGHERGAFTGAERQRAGWFELAEGGTLFLDEVGDLSASTQAKLLRVLQESEFTRVGGSQVIVCDVRVIAATNRDLKRAMAEGGFREDLFYRLNVFPIEMPPLRDRPSDIPLLVAHLAEIVSEQIGIAPPQVTADAIRALRGYRWPGNIRELRNVIERCALLAGGEIRREHLPGEIVGEVASVDSSSSARPTGPGSAASSLEAQEVSLIVQALDASRWNRSEAARRLGVTRDVLRYRMKKHGITHPHGG